MAIPLLWVDDLEVDTMFQVVSKECIFQIEEDASFKPDQRISARD